MTLPSLGIRRVEALHAYVHDLERSRRLLSSGLDFAEVAESGPELTRAGRLGADDPDVARLEGGRSLVALRLERGRAARHLGEVELLEVEAAAPLEVVDVVVERLDAHDAEWLEPGRGQGVLLSGGGASGWRSGCAAWSGASAAQAASTRSRVGYGDGSTPNRRAL